jgi:trigger factor
MTTFSVEVVSPIERRIKVEVEPEAVGQEIERAYRQLNSKVRIPGFRPGKVPRRILEARFREQVEADAIQSLVENSYRETILKSPELVPVSSPRVTNEELKAGQPFRYQATVEVRPEIDPKDYEGLELKKAKIEVTDAQVDEEIGKLRDAMAEMVPVEGRDVQTGDFATVDFEGTADGKPVPGGKGEAAVMEVVEGEFADGKIAALAGAKVGETRELDYTFPADYRMAEMAGKAVHFVVTVKEIKLRKLPELNDQLAKDVGAGETIADLRKRIREEMERRLKSQADQQTREQLIDLLIARNPFEVPSGMVNQQIERKLQQTFERLQSQGIDPRHIKIDFNRMAESMREPATRDVKGALLFDAIAKKERIEVTDSDLEAKVKELAQQLRAPEDAIRSHLLGGEAGQGMRAKLREDKTISLLESKAKLVEG